MSDERVDVELQGRSDVARRQEPAAIVKDPELVREQAVMFASNVELVQELIGRSVELRAKCKTAPPAEAENAESAARDLSLAITHLEDARTRLNAARYKLDGKFSISDAAR